MPVAIVTMIRVPVRPACPSTHLRKRRYMMTPRMVRIDGVKTPPNVPRPCSLSAFDEISSQTHFLRYGQTRPCGRIGRDCIGVPGTGPSIRRCAVP